MQLTAENQKLVTENGRLTLENEKLRARGDDENQKAAGRVLVVCKQAEVDEPRTRKASRRAPRRDE